MLAVTLTFAVLSSLLFLGLGSVIGYLFREYSYDQASRYIPTHPEMFDENGQLIADEVFSVRFENPEALDEDES
tara:strand:+ start:1889 stop:2110 length:222 start_codon:yes stop_codon:yes gene_type:complete